jgi:hypothetical protein
VGRARLLDHLVRPAAAPTTGSSSLSAFAVWRLIANSNFVVLNRQIIWLRALEDLLSIRGYTPEELGLGGLPR